MASANANPAVGDGRAQQGISGKVACTNSQATNSAQAGRRSSRPSWRDKVKVHPAADLFPMMSDQELDELAADIKKQGRLTSPIVYWCDKGGREFLLDGRNRLEAAERAGYELEFWEQSSLVGENTDPYAYVIAANIRRRHLTGEQKRDLIAKLLIADPSKSDRAFAKTVGVDHKTVAAVRNDKEARGEIPHVETRTDNKGRQQPATRAGRGERHVCWQCRVRDEVGKVERHHYVEYEEVWLHPACVADFEKSLAIEQQQLDNVAKHADFMPPTESVAVDYAPIIDDAAEQVRHLVDMLMDDVAPMEWPCLFGTLHETLNRLLAERCESRERAAADPLEIPEFLRRDGGAS